MTIRLNKLERFSTDKIEMLQDVVSRMLAILVTLEVSFTFLENIYSTGITHYDCNIFIVEATSLTIKGLFTRESDFALG